MRQLVCPHCGSPVTGDGLCGTCGLVKPVEQEVAQAHDPGAHITKMRTSQELQPTGGTNMMMGCVLLIFILVLLLGSIFLFKGSDGASSSTAKQPRTPQQQLAEVRVAIMEGRYDAAADKLVVLERMVPKSAATVAKISVLVAALRDPSIDPARAYVAAKELRAMKNPQLAGCGKLGLKALEARALAQLRRADGLYKEEKWADALKAYQQVPDGSEHSGRARRQEREMRNVSATDILARAEKSLVAGKPLEADRLLFAAEGNIKPNRLSTLKQLQKDVLVELEAAAKKQYAAGKGPEALAYLKTRRHKQFFKLYNQIQQVVDYSGQAQARADEGDMREARRLWGQVLRLEPDPAHPYHQQARKGIAELDKKRASSQQREGG